MQSTARSILWLGFFGIILAAWWWMYAMSTGMGLDLLGRQAGMPMDMGAKPAMEMGAEIQSGAESGGDTGADMDMSMKMMTRFTPLFVMWAGMMAAMMLPTMLPTLRAYEDLMVSADGSRAGWLGVLLGYFVVWVGFAAVITGVQLGLLRSGLINMMGTLQFTWLTAALLIVVGLFQFSRTKEICHGVCHSPMGYFLGHWHTGFGGGVRMGLGLGVFCVGCCWGFMSLGFVGGVMNLTWMGLATLFMILEKLPQIGHVVTKPAGVLLVLAGIGVGVWPYLGG